MEPKGEKVPATKRRTNGRQQAAAARWAGVVTTCIKLGGLAIAAHEALFTAPPRDPVVFALAAFMMAGAQGIDSFLSNILGKKS
jgi:hypothetical protein